MAIQTILYQSKRYIPLATGCCEDIYVCLTDEAAALTVDGSKLQLASIANSGRFLGSGGYKRVPRYENPRCNEEYQYTLTYDDTIMQQGQVLTCGDILEVIPYPCAFTTVLNNIQTLPDWVVDSANVVVDANPATDTFDVTIPVIDRVNSVSVGVINLDFSVLYDDTATDIDAYGATAPGGHTVTRAALLGGTTERVQILSQDAGNLIVAGTDNGNFLDNTTIYGLINTTPTIIGDGSAGSPLDVDLSTDAQQGLTLGTDSKLYQASYINLNQAQNDTGGAPTDISGLGTVTLITSANFVIDNSANTRDIDVLLNFIAQANVVIETTGGTIWQIDIQESIDGGGFATTGVKQYGPYNLGAATNKGFPFEIAINSVYTVAAGATLTLQRRIDIITVAAATALSSSATSWLMDWKAIKVSK